MKHLKTFESINSDKLSEEISKSIQNIDDSMSYEDFAESVAKILIDEYGTHNYEPFIETLKRKLGM